MKLLSLTKTISDDSSGTSSSFKIHTDHGVSWIYLTYRILNCSYYTNSVAPTSMSSYNATPNVCIFNKFDL